MPVNTKNKTGGKKATAFFAFRKSGLGDLADRIENLHKTSGMPVSQIIRSCIRHHLPKLEEACDKKIF